MNRLRGGRNAFNLAREFGRGRLFSTWLWLRYMTTGSTGRYRIH